MKNHIQYQSNSITLEHQNQQMLVVIDSGVTDSWMLAAGAQKGAEVVFLDPKPTCYDSSSVHFIAPVSPPQPTTTSSSW